MLILPLRRLRIQVDDEFVLDTLLGLMKIRHSDEKVTNLTSFCRDFDYDEDGHSTIRDMKPKDFWVFAMILAGFFGLTVDEINDEGPSELYILRVSRPVLPVDLGPG